MSFKLGDFLPSGRTPNDLLPPEAPDLAAPRVECATGKTVYASKREARQVARGYQSQQAHAALRVFKCGYCSGYHFGHRLGSGGSLR